MRVKTLNKKYKEYISTECYGKGKWGLYNITLKNGRLILASTLNALENSIKDEIKKIEGEMIRMKRLVLRKWTTKLLIVIGSILLLLIINNQLPVLGTMLFYLNTYLLLKYGNKNIVYDYFEEEGER